VDLVLILSKELEFAYTGRNLKRYRYRYRWLKQSSNDNKSINRRNKMQFKPNVHGVNVKSRFTPYK
jgi:hypothetical protein